MGNLIDQLWSEYQKSKDVSCYKKMIGLIDGEQDFRGLLVGSEIGADALELARAVRLWYQGFDFPFCGLAQKWDGLSNSKISAISSFAFSSIGFQELEVSEIDVRVRFNLSMDEGIGDRELEIFIDLLESNNVEKIRALSFSGCAGDHEVGFQLLGTYVFDACFMMARRQNGVRFYVASVNTPIDALIFPSSGIILKAGQCRFDVLPRFRKLFLWSIRKSQEHLANWSRPSHERLEPINLIKDKRPYHVIADELSGNFHLSQLGVWTGMAFLRRSSFVEGYDVIADEEMQKFGMGRALFSSLSRLDEKSVWSESYRRWLRDRAVEQAQLPACEGKAVWIGISGGEKRSWLEEEAGLVAVIQWVVEKFGLQVSVVFDGWTATSKPSASDLAQISIHNKIMERVIERSGFERNRCFSVIGAQIMKKIAYASKCDFFFACAGTPAMWPSNICRVPGVVHNSTAMINNVDNTMSADLVIKVPLDKITDIREGMRKDRRDFVSYSISPEDVVDCCDQAVSKFGLLV